MAFLVSPGVQVQEKDLSNVIPAVAASIGAYAGPFKWGPAGEAITVSSEADLLTEFGKPDAATAVSFLTAASFLKYGNTLKVSRAINTTSVNAISTYPYSGSTLTYAVTTLPANTTTLTVASTSTLAIRAKVGSTLTGTHISSSTTTVTSAAASGTNIVLTFSPATTNTVTSSTTLTIGNLLTVADETSNASNTAVFGNYDTFNNHYPIARTDQASTASNTTFIARYPGDLGNSVTVTVFNSNSGTASTDNGFEFKPTAADNIHVLVTDRTGIITGTANTVLERWQDLSLYKDSKRADGTNNYYFDYINRNSSWIYAVGLRKALVEQGYNTTDVNQTATTITASVNANTGIVFDLGGLTQFKGADGTVGTGDISTALDVFADAASIDVNLLFCGDVSGTTTLSAAERNIQTIAGNRKDVVGFISAPVNIWQKTSNADKKDAVITKFNTVDKTVNGSYTVLDSSPVYVYNKYQDNYVWIPACGHIAGLCANTDEVADAWFSPAGFNRGGLRGVTKLAYNPDQSHRDELYLASINPIVAFPGQGIVLFGDKTAQAKPSAFDRINVRRLFIVLEKAIATAAKYQLFELNDRFTQAMFRNMTEPFLRDIQGRRGITDFLVVCDSTNNTPEVIDTNRFVADIYIKPARSINFITLNFIATRTGVSFTEIAGASNAQ